jgi:hypothetical protein
MLFLSNIALKRLKSPFFIFQRKPIPLSGLPFSVSPTIEFPKRRTLHFHFSPSDSCNDSVAEMFYFQRSCILQRSAIPYEAYFQDPIVFCDKPFRACNSSCAVGEDRMGKQFCRTSGSTREYTLRNILLFDL